MLKVMVAKQNHTAVYTYRNSSVIHIWNACQVSICGMLTLVVHDCAGCHFQHDTLISLTVLDVVMTLYSIMVKAISLVANVERHHTGV